MKTLNKLFLLTILGTAVSACSSGGGDTTSSSSSVASSVVSSSSSSSVIIVPKPLSITLESVDFKRTVNGEVTTVTVTDVASGDKIIK